MYTTFNVIFLGFVSTDTQVGYFSTATKLYALFLSVFLAITGVLVPKVSESLAKNDYISLNKIATFSLKFVLIFSLPLIIISDFYAPCIIQIFGSDFDGAITPFRIVMTLIIVVALEQIIITQFLMAVNKSKYVVILSLTGATIGVILNCLITKSMGAVGSSISWTCSEVALLLLAIYYFKHQFSQIKIEWLKLIKYPLFSIPYVVICYMFYSNRIDVTSICGVTCCFIWFILSTFVFLKNDFPIDINKIFRKRF